MRLLLAALLISGCAAAQTEAYPFGAHRFAYPADVIRPAGTQAALDAAVRERYDRWKAAYLTARCGGFLIKTGGGTGAKDALTHSEGHGYGMVTVAMMAGHDPEARRIFDGFLAVYRRYPSENDKDLMAWAIGDDCTAIAGPDSATDGDLDVAFALLLAHRQWGDPRYLAEAKRNVAAIARREMNAKSKLPLLGDWATDDEPEWYHATRPSDFMVDHFRSFAALAGEPIWRQAVDAAHGLVGAMQVRHAPATGLVPDFVINTAVDPAPPAGKFLESARDGFYGSNSCRLPWRLATDYVVSGDARAKTALDRMTTWIKSRTDGDPSKIVAGYKLDGTPLRTRGAMSFEAPFAAAAIVDRAHQPWLDALWRRIVEGPPQGYFSDSIRVLAMIVISGNWWAPEK